MTVFIYILTVGFLKCRAAKFAKPWFGFQI